jgi:urea transport system substrate-binding protein
VAEIRQRAPDVILNTINGSGNRHFFAALADAGLQDLPVVSFSIAEPELAVLAHAPPHHHAVWGYFQSLPQENNRAFVARYQARFGHDRPISDPIATTYAGVRLWAMAVRDAGTDDPTQINLTIGRMSSDGPLGIAALDTATRHLWRRVYVGQARADGQFDAHEISEAPVRPAPFPPYRSKEAWLQTVAELTRPAPGERP